MSWWKRFWGGSEIRLSHQRLNTVKMTMPGWVEDALKDDIRRWRDSQGNLLTLAFVEGSLGSLHLWDETVLQAWARQLASPAGLIEVRALSGVLGATVGIIYKQLQMPAYLFTGMLFVPAQEFSQVWTIVAGEHGTTGDREAIITEELFNTGQFSIQDYESSWAQDPYDPTFRGVDKSVLRFVSDNECYDERFPEHPLSKVRQVLAALPNSVQVVSVN